MEFSVLLGRVPNSGRMEIITILSDNVTLFVRCFRQIRESTPPPAIPAKRSAAAAGGWW